MPAALTAMRISPGPGAGSGRSCTSITSGGPCLLITRARIAPEPYVSRGSGVVTVMLSVVGRSRLVGVMPVPDAHGDGLGVLPLNRPPVAPVVPAAVLSGRGDVDRPGAAPQGHRGRGGCGSLDDHRRRDLRLLRDAHRRVVLLHV